MLVFFLQFSCHIGLNHLVCVEHIHTHYLIYISYTNSKHFTRHYQGFTLPLLDKLFPSPCDSICGPYKGGGVVCMPATNWTSMMQQLFIFSVLVVVVVVVVATSMFFRPVTFHFVMIIIILQQQRYCCSCYSAIAVGSVPPWCVDEFD